MQCRDIHLLLHEALDRILTGEEQIHLDDHLATCELCRADAVLLHAVIQAVEETPTQQPSEDFTLKVMDRLPAPVFGLIPVAVFRALVAAIGIIAATVGWVYRAGLIQSVRELSAAAAEPNPISASFQHAASSIYMVGTTIIGYIPDIDMQRLTPVLYVLIAIGVAHVILQMVDAFEPAEFESAVDQTY